MSPTRATLLGVAAAISALLAGPPESPSAGEAAVQAATSPAAVRIDNFNFSPPTLVVAPGTTVTWTNADDSPHTVREKDGKFNCRARHRRHLLPNLRGAGRIRIFLLAPPANGREDRRQTRGQVVRQLNWGTVCWIGAVRLREVRVAAFSG
jgi:plastocyanin